MTQPAAGAERKKRTIQEIRDSKSSGEKMVYMSVPDYTAAKWAETAGVDVAVPRVAVVSIGSTLMFNPSAIPVEQGDYVQWINAGAGSHTTTSGAPSSVPWMPSSVSSCRTSSHNNDAW